MATVHYRPARAEELPATVNLFLTALSDLYARQGTQTPLPERSTIEMLYGYIFRTGIFHVAEIEGRLAAICHAVVRGHLWFLSGFWALPELQGKRIGGALLKRVWAEGASLGAQKFFTWSSTDTTAMATYLRAGMLPGYQMLAFTGAPDKLPERPAGYEAEALVLSTAMHLDEQLRETAREIDHRFWQTESGHEGRQVLHRGAVIGYYYFNQGVIGPAAWTSAEHAAALVTLACIEAAASAPQIRLMAPGVNHAAIRVALQTGLRLSGYAHLLMTAPFGKMEQYLPSGPSLF